ncbi:MAG: threonylcarbamoyl-AMP synthase [Salinivirgaceae bacterium]|nr:threonylcarbamoyl-AMP synthase [Salinivirgaceae bacterium]
MQEDIKKALEVLRNGGVILYPTDTIWGIGCDATNKEAVQRIYEIKKRKDNKSMIVLVDSVGRLTNYIDEIPDIAYDLMEVSDKPLTVILEGAKNLAENVINQKDKSIGVRLVNEVFCQRLIQQLKKPIVSTSANISSESSAKTFAEISDEIIKQVDFVVNYRQDDALKCNPSGIIKISKNGEIKVIRE